MAGVTKRKYNHEIVQYYIKNLKRPLLQIFSVLPAEYNGKTILDLFIQLYPFEWKTLNERYRQYRAKDEFLKKCKKPLRYYPVEPSRYLLSLPIVRARLTQEAMNRHRQNFDEAVQQTQFSQLVSKRNQAIQRRQEKIATATETIQSLEPLYLDAFIHAYHQKGITTEDKIEIFNEIAKYRCEKSTEFFSKLNAAERNDQIRKMAHDHLQKIDQYVRLRKKFKGKSKPYVTETSSFNMTPADLVQRIEKNSIQNRKSFDMFISHSSRDASLIKKIIKALNAHNISVYCDWTSDSDFLKRELVSEFTKIVLLKRLEQSRSLLYIRTDNSVIADWVKLELAHFATLNKPMYYIDFTDQAAVDGSEKLEYDEASNSIIDGDRLLSQLKKQAIAGKAAGKSLTKR